MSSTEPRAARPVSWAQRFLETAPPERLATCRILVGAFGFAYVVMRTPELLTARHAPGTYAPVGLFHLVAEPPRDSLAALLVAATLLLALPFALGWRFRATAPLYALSLLALLSWRSSWGMIFHSENLLFLETAVLALAPSADALSLDVRRRPAPPRELGHGWPLRTMAAAIVVAYFLAGVAKVRLTGWEWVTGDYLRHQVAYDAVRKLELGAAPSPLGVLMVRHAWIFPPFAAFAVAVELGAPLALLGRSPGRVWATGMWLFHWGVLAVMGIPFHFALSAIAFLPFFDGERLAERALRRLRRSRAGAR